MINWDYDLKLLVLSKDEYDKDHPIKNILKAKTTKDVEYLPIVEKIFDVVFDDKKGYKDIMNSFWYTYKYMLQVKYPLYFPHKKNLNPTILTNSNEKEEVQNLPIPTLGSISDEYMTYYKTYFSDTLNLQPNKNKELTWLDFLINNFNVFPLVHHHEELNTFAKLTHTIGNIMVVPKGFNRGRGAFDYWDYAMIYLYDFLYSKNTTIWKDFLKEYELQSYVEKYPDNLTVKPFWSNHFKKNAPFYPKDIQDIETFLKTVNTNIEKRGLNILQRYKVATIKGSE